MKKTIFSLLLVASNLAVADEMRFLRADKDALQARVDIVQEAKKEILVEYYSVWNDDQAIGGMALLIDAAKKGIKVKVILDSLSTTVPKKTFAALLALANEGEVSKNLEIKEYNPLSFNLFKATHRDHAKMLIADGETLITGGRNIGDKYFGVNRRRNFSDLDLMAKGNVAKLARENFLTTWNSPAVKTLRLGKYSPERLAQGSCTAFKNQEECEIQRVKSNEKFESEKARILEVKEEVMTYEEGDLVVPYSGNDWFKDAYVIDDVKFMSHGAENLVSKETAYLNEDLLKAVANAKEDVNIISPYLMPTPNLMKVFADLRSKGVRIRIITNSMNSTDNLFAQAGYRELKFKLIEMGLEIYEYNGPDTIHAKTAVVDNRVVLIGTYNIDPRSAFINREIGVIINDEFQTGLANDLTHIIQGFRENSTLVGKDGVPHNLDIEMKGVSKKKRALLKVISKLLPLIRNQL
ncbi:phospholipase D-like domain-containing protein [Peredibacter starrii]|uniref:Phosphatidylserine/phosphatidylglycerophosphate/ cardiolipin synthase family protein n=1 Tax=Peredibacter starrii TaxID=28202 RepID=A0AAX4HS78_9BACT|nr:phosphatidylserine/phosphatidylglycerophosphate/cardiolipin synthase family protein [Peredibacter starrii]WPU66253.1 phosphatidylserine/phosphatidylglycerophosphate/cardiolipin synthase family protein [Peredibacter starrii]